MFIFVCESLLEALSFAFERRVVEELLEGSPNVSGNSAGDELTEL